MFVSVIPFGTSFSVEPLTYFVGDSFRSEIKTGQLVQIPYGKKQIFGIVSEVINEDLPSIPKDREIKPIEGIVSFFPILASYQIEMIYKLSRKYIIPIHKALSIFFPSPVLARLQKYNFPLIQNDNKTHTKKDYSIYIAKDTVISPEMLLPLMASSIVMIAPDDLYLERLKGFFENHSQYKDIITIFPAEMTDTKRSQMWIDIYNKKTPIIIGTRRLLQYNLDAYDEIWYFEDSFVGEYFQYPIRMQYTDFLAYIVDSNRFSVKIFTSVPQIRTLSQFHFFSLFHL